MTITAIQLFPLDEALPILETHSKKPVLPIVTRTQLIEAFVMIIEDIIQGQGKAFACENKITDKTVFHAKVLPSINLRDYITRFFHYAKCQDEMLIMTLIYLDRIGEVVKNFSLDSFNVHK